VIRRRRPIRPTRLTVVLDVHPENRRPRAPPPLGHRVVTHAGEADLVVRRPPWLRPTDPIARVAELAHDRARPRIPGAREARTHEAVEGAPVEVAHEAGPHVPDVRPFTLDARRVRAEERDEAQWRTHLAAMGRVLHRRTGV